MTLQELADLLKSAPDIEQGYRRPAPKIDFSQPRPFKFDLDPKWGGIELPKPQTSDQLLNQDDEGLGPAS
jgi:hypothetical protein